MGDYFRVFSKFKSSDQWIPERTFGVERYAEEMAKDIRKQRDRDAKVVRL